MKKLIKMALQIRTESLIKVLVLFTTLVAAMILDLPSVGAAEDLSKIKWVTNDTAKPFSSPKAQRGGVYQSYMSSYPLTFRLYGPNSNDMFANYNQPHCFSSLVGSFSLVIRHPETLEYIPSLATHWAVMKDQKTLYFKLDPDVRYNDGHPVRADDYVFAFEMMRSEHIKDPVQNKVYREDFISVEKIDDLTIKIVGAYPSWQALDKYQITPIAKHATVLDENWIRKYNWSSPVCVGAYKITDFKEGRYVTFERVKNWWGDEKKYLKNLYNFDRLNFKIIRDNNVAFEHFKKGELSQFTIAKASDWKNNTDFDDIKKGWIVKKKVMVKGPDGPYGLLMNLKSSVFKNKDFRKSLAYLFDFNKLNDNLMFGAYERRQSWFAGTEYDSPNSFKYPDYNPKKAAELLTKAGFKTRGSDGILINAQGERASFFITYGEETFSRHLSVIAEDFKAAGVEMKLKLVDSAKAFKDGLEKNFEMKIISMTAGLFPEPEQYFHSDHAKTMSNNNFASYSNPEMDQQIKIYKEDLDIKKRKAAMNRIEELIRDEGFYIPLWGSNFIRILYWNNLGHIPNYEPMYSYMFNGNYTWWFDAEADKKLKVAQSAKTTIPNVNDVIEVGPNKK